MHEISKALEGEPARLLLVGPAQAKTRLKSHLEREHPLIAKNIAGVESIDRATDGQIVHFAKTFFTKLGVFDAI